MMDYAREMMDLKTLVTRTLEKKGVLAKIGENLYTRVSSIVGSLRKLGFLSDPSYYCLQITPLSPAASDGDNGFRSLESEYVRRYHRHEPRENQYSFTLIKHIKAPIHLVWSLVRRFDQPHKYKPFVSRCVVQGDLEIGSVREVNVKSGLPATTNRERLEFLDDDEHILSIRIVGDDHRLKVDPLTHQVKFCDFGSAKVLLVEIIKVLGTPTREEIRCMNPNYTDFRFPQIKAHPWHKVFHKRMPLEAIDLASRLLQYSPSLRCTALEACAHSFFDELREPNARLPNGRPLPPLFNFKQRGFTG